MRALLWGQQFDQEYRQSIFRDQKEHVLMRVCHVMKVEHLFNGRDVVIDSCALSNRTRRLLFDTNIVDRFSVVATKYLLHVAVTGHTISERNRGRGRVSDWVPRWVPPVANREYRIIHLHNDTEAQLQENFRLLDQHFSE